MKRCRNSESSAAVVAAADPVTSARESEPSSDLGVVAVRKSRREPFPTRRLLDHTATVRRHHRSAAPDRHHQ